MEQSMKAVGFRRFGPANVLETLDVPKPTLTSHTVLIRVGAASVNPGDWQIRNGRFRFFIRSRLPFIPGADVAGTVEQVGSDVTRFHPGDAVYAIARRRFDVSVLQRLLRCTAVWQVRSNRSSHRPPSWMHI